MLHLSLKLHICTTRYVVDKTARNFTENQPHNFYEDINVRILINNQIFLYRQM